VEVSAAVLDTSALIALFRGHAGVASASRTLDRIVLPAVALGEVLVGRLGSARTAGSGRGGASGLREIRAFLASPRVEVTGLGAETAERYALIREYLRSAGRPVPTNDIWIAAAAMELGLRVLTLDRHYLSIPQIFVELFERQ
jgi:predicted nucleic acid-binding protein